MASSRKKSKVTSVVEEEFEEEVKVEQKNEIIIPAISSKHSQQVLEEEDSDDAPEAVSISTSKAQMISKIKSQRDALRQEKEVRRKKTVEQQEQNRQTRLRKSETQKYLEDAIVEEETADESAVKDEKPNQTLFPLPENVLQNAFTVASAVSSSKQVRFYDDDEEDSCEEQEEGVNDFKEIDRELSRITRAQSNKTRLIDTLPYSVSEISHTRLTPHELKARRAISKSKLITAGAQVRRIDSVLDRARKSRKAAAVFNRSNNFY